jgi:hypothetical protein
VAARAQAGGTGLIFPFCTGVWAVSSGREEEGLGHFLTLSNPQCPQQISTPGPFQGKERLVGLGDDA